MSEQSGTLGCEVDRLEYDFNKRIGRLFMPKDNCCDMSGCVAMFERIDPHVKRIETFAAGKPDTMYGRPNGWVAYASGQW